MCHNLSLEVVILRHALSVYNPACEAEKPQQDDLGAAHGSQEPRANETCLKCGACSSVEHNRQNLAGFRISDVTLSEDVRNRDPIGPAT